MGRIFPWEARPDAPSSLDNSYSNSCYITCVFQGTASLSLQLSQLLQQIQMSGSLYLMLVGIALAAAAPQYNSFGNGIVNPGLVNPGYFGGVHPNPGFVQPGLVNQGFGLQQPIQFNQAGLPCEKFSRNQFGNYVCTETLQQIAPRQFEVGGSQFGGGVYGR